MSTSPTLLAVARTYPDEWHIPTTGNALRVWLAQREARLRGCGYQRRIVREAEGTTLSWYERDDIAPMPDAGELVAMLYALPR